ncbi:sensor domain-containing diguanylate cyclase [Methylobacterium organophilum]|nr:sensor domain-containing diguanylate cyclase [Methylobacterium organophilum]
MPQTPGQTEMLEAQLFELAPVSLWLQDLGALKARLDAWREAGMVDLRAWLRDPGHLRTCQSLIRIVRVNRSTLATYDARDEAELFAHIPAIFDDPRAEALIEVLCQLWAGATQVRLVTRNRTVSGRVIDVSYAGQMLPGHEAGWTRYLISVEDITRREALRRERDADRRTGTLFQHAPVPTLIRDETGVAARLAALRADGITDLAGHLAAHPGWLAEAEASRRIVDANRPALALFGVDTCDALARHLDGGLGGGLGGGFGSGLGEAPLQLFREELAELWDGAAPRSRDIAARSRDGRDLHLKMQRSPVPEAGGGRRLVQIALTDIGDNKRSEARLAVLSLTDPLTGLLNRLGYAAALDRLEAGRTVPTSVIVADLNDLKATNDDRGHDAGDDVIRRFGAILERHSPVAARPARIGGDEFVILLPGLDAADAAALARRILDGIDGENRPGAAVISAALGSATWRGDGGLKAAVSRADSQMYAAKRRYRDGAWAGRPPVPGTSVFSQAPPC